MENKKVAIIIPTYNQDLLLEKCLLSLENKTHYKNYKIFLVDDSGKGKIGEKIKKRFKKVKVIINKKNLGAASSINIGIKDSLKFYKPDYALIFTDDCEIINKDWLQKIVNVSQDNEKFGITGCRVLYPNKSLQWSAEKGKIRSFDKKGNFNLTDDMKQIQEVSDVMGCCFLIKKEVINKIGFLDEKFSPVYGEETDYCFRARKKGFKCIYVGTTEIIHHGASSTNKIESNFMWYIKKRNAIRLEWLNYNIPKILKYTLIHFGSCFFGGKILKKLELLTKAYNTNLKNLKEIKLKRKERNSWLKN